MEPELLKTWEAFADKYEKNWTDYEEQVWKDAKASNTVSVHFLGISESVFDKLEWRGEKCSWDTFKSGNYVLVDYGNKYAERLGFLLSDWGYFSDGLQKWKPKRLRSHRRSTDAICIGLSVCGLYLYHGIGSEEEYITQTGMNQPCMLPLMQRRARTSR